MCSGKPLERPPPRLRFSYALWEAEWSGQRLLVMQRPSGGLKEGAREIGRVWESERPEQVAL